MGGGPAGNCWILRHVFLRLVSGLCPSLPFSKTVSSVRLWFFSVQTRGVKLTSPKVILLHFRSITAPDSVKNYVLNMPAVSVGGE